MNCQRLHLLLDSCANRELDADVTVAIERHLAQCESCRSAWNAFDALVRMSVPPLPPGLGDRTAETLVGLSPLRRPSRRGSRLIGSALIAGASLAAAYSFFADEPTGDDPSSNDYVLYDPDSPPLPESLDLRRTSNSRNSSPARRRADGQLSAATATGGGIVDAPTLDPFSIVVISAPNKDAGPTALTVFDVCRDYVLEGLYGLQGINVIAGDRVSAYRRADTAPRDIARALGAGVFVDLHMPSEAASCNALVVDTSTGLLIDGFGGVIPPTESTHLLRELAETFVRTIADTVLSDDRAVEAEARARLLDVALPDADRVAAILSLRRPAASPLEGLIDEPIKAALMQIAMSSTDATARSNAVFALRGQTDRDLIEVLLYVLENDEHEDARRNAAYALHYFAGDYRVKNALMLAVKDQSAVETSAPRCCVQTVGEAAERSLSDDDTVIAMTLAHFMSDGSSRLTDAERLRILTASPDGRAMFPFPLPNDVARTVHEIGIRAAESELRRTAWMILGFATPGAGMPQTLFEDMVSHPNEAVRSAAAITLARHVENPAVRELIDAALSAELSTEIRRTLTVAVTRADLQQHSSVD